MQKMARQDGKARQGKMARQGMPSKARWQGRKDARTQGKDAAAGRRTARRSKVAQYSHTDFERVLRCAVVKIFE
jgi:hypothetical protein